MASATIPWWEGELAGCTFADARLGQRLQKIIERIGGAIGASLPLACQDWASTKAAYRFFSNDRVSEDEILAGHFGSTRERTTAAEVQFWCPRTPRSSPTSVSALQTSASHTV